MVQVATYRKVDGQDHLSKGSLRHGRLSQSGIELVDGGLRVFARSRSAPVSTE
jgi:hypothetical protein